MGTTIGQITIETSQVGSGIERDRAFLIVYVKEFFEVKDLNVVFERF